jgi:hypothetical protein
MVHGSDNGYMLNFAAAVVLHMKATFEQLSFISIIYWIDSLIEANSAA